MCVQHEGHDAAICGQSAKKGKSTDNMAQPVFSTWFQQVLKNSLDACLRQNTKIIAPFRDSVHGPYTEKIDAHYGCIFFLGCFARLHVPC